MNNPLRMGGFQRIGNLPSDRQRFINWKRSLRNPIRERRAFDQFEDKRLPVSCGFQPVDVTNVRMIQ